MITSAEYLYHEGEPSNIEMVRDGVKFIVPISEDNTDYAELMKRVEAGELEILDATGGE